MKWYLCGPFWDKDCSEFFDSFIRRCEETSMSNKTYVRKESNSLKLEVSEVEYVVNSKDTVFVPGHFKVDFNKIKSEYDPESFRRVLGQVLRLDLENIDSDTGLVVYSKGYDLGSMFELGYFLGINGIADSKYYGLNILRKKLIIKDIDKDNELQNCINYFLDDKVRSLVINKYSTSSDSIAISDGIDINLLNGREYGAMGLNVDVYRNTPFNSILAGYLYSYNIPFFTYSSENNDSNVMMLASSIFHIKIDENLLFMPEIKDKSSYNSKLFWDNSYFNKFKDIK